MSDEQAYKDLERAASQMIEKWDRKESPDRADVTALRGALRNVQRANAASSKSQKAAKKAAKKGARKKPRRS